MWGWIKVFLIMGGATVGFLLFVYGLGRYTDWKQGKTEPRKFSYQPSRTQKQTNREYPTTTLQRDYSTSPSYDFKHTTWGMSLSLVKTIMESDKKWKFINHTNIPEIPGSTTIYYEGELHNSLCLLFYHFKHGRLFSSNYTFPYTSDDLTARIFKIVGTRLAGIYGKGSPINRTATQWATKDERTLIRLNYIEKFDIELIYLSTQYLRDNE